MAVAGRGGYWKSIGRHHQKPLDGNYGIIAGFALFDWLFGTARPYFKHVAEVRGGEVQNVVKEAKEVL